MFVCLITHWVTTKKGLKLKLFAVPAVFAVVELRGCENMHCTRPNY